MERSADGAEGVTGVTAVAELLSRLGSGVVLSTIAVLIISPVAAGPTVDRIRIVCSSPRASCPMRRKPGQGAYVWPPSVEYWGLDKMEGRLSVSEKQVGQRTLAGVF